MIGGPSPADPGKGGHGGGSPLYLIPSGRARNVQAGVRSVGNTSPLPRPAVLTLAGGVDGFARVFATKTRACGTPPNRDAAPQGESLWRSEWHWIV